MLYIHWVDAFIKLLYIVLHEKVTINKFRLVIIRREYTSELSNSQMGKALQKQLRIESSQLLGKLKKIEIDTFPACDVATESGQNTITSGQKKWLGLQHCFSDTALYGSNAL